MTIDTLFSAAKFLSEVRDLGRHVTYCSQLGCPTPHWQLAAPRYHYFVVETVWAPRCLYQPLGHLLDELLSAGAARDYLMSQTSFGDFGECQARTSLKIYIFGVD